MKKSLAILAVLAAAVPCAAQQGSGTAGHHNGGTAPAGAPAPATSTAPADTATLRAEYAKFESQLKAESTKNGIVSAYDKYTTPDYTFVRSNKAVLDRAKFLANAKGGKFDRPVDGVDSAYLHSRSFQEAGSLVTVTTKTEQTYRQDYPMPNGTVAKGAKITRDLNVTETFVSAGGGWQLKKTDLTDVKLYVNGTLTATP